MFKDLKEYQEITRIYHESVNISEEQRAINKMIAEAGFTDEEILYFDEHFDELWESELEALSEEYIIESYKEQNLTEEQLNEILGASLGIKAAKTAGKMLKKGVKAVVKRVPKGVKTGIKDTLSGVKEVGKKVVQKAKPVLKKVGNVLKKVPGVALPVAAVGGAVAGINALRKRGKAKREAELDKKIQQGIKDSGMGDKGTAMTMQGIKDASYNRGVKAAQDKAKAEAEAKKGGEKAGEAGAEALKDKKTETKTKPMSKIEFQNRKRFGDDAIDKKKAMNVDFKKMRRGEMSKKEFIDTYPKSQTAKKYNQSDKAYRDYKKGLKKENFEHLDAYDMVLEYLFATDQVSTIEEAHYVMLEMDQQTIGDIVKEVKVALSEDV